MSGVSLQGGKVTSTHFFNLERFEKKAVMQNSSRQTRERKKTGVCGERGVRRGSSHRGHAPAKTTISS